MSALTPYITWLIEEIKRKQYGDVSIKFSIYNGQIKLISKESTETKKVN